MVTVLSPSEKREFASGEKDSEAATVNAARKVATIGIKAMGRNLFALRVANIRMDF